MNIIPDPESEILKHEIEKLKMKLNDTVVEYEHLVNHTLGVLADKYMSLVGEHKLSLLDAECLARRLKRKIELIQARINSGLIPVMPEIEKILEEEMQEWYRNIDKFNHELNQAKVAALYYETAPDQPEIRAVFRKLSKLLHPDMNPNHTEEMLELWHRVQFAYKNADLFELRAIEVMIESKNIQVESVSGRQQLLDFKEKLESSIAHYQRKIEVEKSGYPYQYIFIVDNEAAVEAEIVEIESKIEFQQQLIDKYKVILTTMGFSEYGGYSLN